MTVRRSKDNPDSPPRPEKLLTSQDLFGDMVDAPFESAEAPAGEERTAPIRVQISEPLAGMPRAVRSEPNTPMREVAPEEVEALLGVFEAPRAEPPPKPPAPSVKPPAPKAAPPVAERPPAAPARPTPPPAP